MLATIETTVPTLPGLPEQRLIAPPKPKGKPRVMLDLDGTVYQWERTARYLLRDYYADSRYGFIPPALYEASTHWDYIQDHVSEDAWSWLWTEGVRKGLFREGHIYTGAGEAIHELSQFARVVVVTKRPEAAVNDTLDWLSFRRWAISGFHFLTGEDEVKSSVTPHFEVYIDDSLDVMADLAANTDGHLLLVDRPWNRVAVEDLSTRVERTWDWSDTIDKTRAALKQRGFDV